MDGVGSVAAGRDRSDKISRDDGPTVTAVVTDKRVSTTMVRGVSRTGHDIRSEFEFGGASSSAGDSTGRADLFIGIDEDRWNQLAKGDSVEAIHQDGNPANTGRWSRAGESATRSRGCSSGCCSPSLAP